MGIRQNHIDRAWQLEEFTPAHFTTLVSTTLRAGPESSIVSQFNSLGIPGINLDTNGDSVRLLKKLTNVDTTQRIYFRVNWTSDSTTSAHSVVWTMTYKIISPDQDVISFSSPTAMTPATVTDTVGSTTAYKIRRTNALYIPADSVNRTDHVALEFEATTLTGLTNCYLLNVEMLYYPRPAIGISRPSPAMALPSDWTVAS
jgi:hypothetical protein